jgi:very-short-patch-repair endonuclease
MGAKIPWEELLNPPSSPDTEDYSHLDGFHGHELRLEKVPSWDEFRSCPMSFDNGMLRCPACGSVAIEGGDGPDDVEVTPDSDDYEPDNPLKYRGGFTVIRMWCTCGVHLALITGNHKGSVYHRLLAAGEKLSRAGFADDSCGMRKTSHGWCGFKRDHAGDCFYICLDCGEPLNGRDLFCNSRAAELDKIRAEVATMRSPIEKMFWAAYRFNTPPRLYGLVPQFSVEGGKYFIDFALPDQKIGVELDGFDHHSSTADIERDRKRQRYLEKAGWRIIRFGGAEVHRDPAKCVREVSDLVIKWTENGSS